jgi:ATP-dependent DNA helicase RecQ
VGSHDGYRLGQLQEFVWFTERLKAVSAASAGSAANAGGIAGKLSPSMWKQTIQELRDTFKRSDDLGLVLRAIESFSDEFKRKHLMDWQEYCAQVRLEDILFPEEQQTYISTFHKAKGKEFDSVFLFLDGFKVRKDNDARAIYVALTRARDFLEVHTNMPYFDGFAVEEMEWVDGGVEREGFAADNSRAPLPPMDEVECGLRDVVLNHFKGIDAMLAVRPMLAGDTLQVDQGKATRYTDLRGNVIAVLSEKMRGVVEEKLAKGYVVKQARVGHVVWWYCEEDGKRYRVVLPRLEMGLGSA